MTPEAKRLAFVLGGVLVVLGVVWASWSISASSTQARAAAGTLGVGGTRL